MPIQQLFLGTGPSGPPDGQANYITEGGTFSWVCPDGITSVSVACIGGGGGGGGGQTQVGGGLYSGGGGGGCAYKNNISVTPGTSYTVVVGHGRYNTSTTGGDGGDSYFLNTSTCFAKGGQSASGSGLDGGYASQCVGDGKYSGGNGGAYGGNGYGGAGSSSNGANGSGNTGGAGGNGGGGGAGGGTGSDGQGGGGSNNGQFIGAAGGGGGSGANSKAGGGGGGGNIGTVTGTSPTAGIAAFQGTFGGGAGKWGGGGGGSPNAGGFFVGGNYGAVRIIWNPSGTPRAFPGTNIGDLA
tara:strand:+ start:354 stop:1244 length:891 start_codon:yes stop_codon:yes gene_type:complete